MAELVAAHDSGSCGGNLVKVQVLSSAPIISKRKNEKFLNMDIERIGEKLFGWWIWLGFFIFIGLGGFFAIWFIVKGIFHFILSFENNYSLNLMLATIIPPFVLYKASKFWWNVMFVDILIPFLKNNIKKL